MGWKSKTPSRKWENVTSLVSVPVTSGRVLFQRDGHQRTLVLDTVTFAAAGSGTFLVLPADYGRPAFTESAVLRGLTINAQVTQYGNVQGYSWTTSPIAGRITWSTEGVA